MGVFVAVGLDVAVAVGVLVDVDVEVGDDVGVAVWVGVDVAVGLDAVGELVGVAFCDPEAESAASPGANRRYDGAAELVVF